MANNKLTDEPMSLDTAIVHADERAASLSGSCAVQHTQLANWLRELQERRKADNAEPVAMKDHELRELVNALLDIAVEYHGTQQLRDRIARTVSAAMLKKENR